MISRDTLPEAVARLARFTRDSAFNDDVVTRATVIEVLGTEVRVATPEDLLLMKIEANRPIDLDDAIAIKDAFAGRLDLPYLTTQADRLGADVRRRLDLLLPRS